MDMFDDLFEEKDFSMEDEETQEEEVEELDLDTTDDEDYDDDDDAVQAGILVDPIDPKVDVDVTCDCDDDDGCSNCSLDELDCSCDSDLCDGDSCNIPADDGWDTGIKKWDTGTGQRPVPKNVWKPKAWKSNP